MTMQPRTTCTKAPEAELVTAAAVCIASLANKAVARHGSCSIALSGGNSPRKLYRHLAQKGISAMTDMPWQQTELFWGDERCVPPEARESNYRMAKEELIDRIAIPKSNIHPMPHVTRNVMQAAEQYSKELRKAFMGRMRMGLPVFDIIILGLGPDGHTASLFPGDPKALNEKSRWVTVATAPKAMPPNHRLTLTLPVINNADTIVFYVPGQEKTTLAEEIMHGQNPSLPAGMVAPSKGTLYWFIGS